VISIGVPSMLPRFFPEVHDELLGLADIPIFVFAPSRQLGYLVFVFRSVVIAHQVDNCGVICKLDDPVAAVYGCHV